MRSLGSLMVLFGLAMLGGCVYHWQLLPLPVMLCLILRAVDQQHQHQQLKWRRIRPV